MDPEIIPDNLTPPPLLISSRPWGFWASIGWTLLIFIAFIGVQIVVGIVIALVNSDIADLDQEEVGSNGMLLAMMTCFGAPVVVGLCGLFAFLRKQFPFKNYLGIKWVESREIRRWCIWLLVLVVVSDALTSFMGKPIVPDFMFEVYDTAGNVMPLLWFALIVAAPFSEEFLFRGFLFTGLKYSRLGANGAVVVTALVWAVIHLQYDFYGMATIFVSGIFLGMARLKTDSIWLCIVLHGLMNLIATLEVAAYHTFISP